jgi:hypothetical protein
MNKRIKELALQAKEYARSFNHQHEVFEKKFAELIVRECADAADMSQDAGCEYAGDYVAEYMGYGQEHGVAEWRAK